MGRSKEAVPGGCYPAGELTWKVKVAHSEGGSPSLQESHQLKDRTEKHEDRPRGSCLWAADQQELMFPRICEM